MWTCYFKNMLKVGFFFKGDGPIKEAKPPQKNTQKVMVFLVFNY